MNHVSLGCVKEFVRLPPRWSDGASIAALVHRITANFPIFRLNAALVSHSIEYK